MKGRDEPATFPRVTQIRLVSRAFPWMISVVARDPTKGVLCGEVVEQIYQYLDRHTSQQEYNAQSKEKRKAIIASYKTNRSTVPGVPGGALGSGLKCFDYLGNHTMFGGVAKNDSLVKSLCGDVLPCTLELKCTLRYAPTAAEAREQEERSRTDASENERLRRQEAARANARANSRPGSRAHSRARSRNADDDSDDDDDDDD